jgi:hypothetical protein
MKRKKDPKSAKVSSGYIDFNKFNRTILQEHPFEYMVVPNFIKKEKVESVVDDFPEIAANGSFPLDSVKSGKKFLEFIEELKGKQFRNAVERKFSIDLTDKPVMVTARGVCGSRDGKIHIDSKGKIITVLLYLNKQWDSDGGRLRLLNNNHDLEDYVAEVEPLAGTLVIFKCANNAWHGHKQFFGKRNSIQLNWVIDNSYLEKERNRHKFSAWIKKIKNLFKI